MIVVTILILLTICAILLAAIITILAEILGGYSWERYKSGYKGWRDQLGDYGAELFHKQMEKLKRGKK